MNFEPFVCKYNLPPDLFTRHPSLGHVRIGMKLKECTCNNQLYNIKKENIFKYCTNCKIYYLSIEYWMYKHWM